MHEVVAFYVDSKPQSATVLLLHMDGVDASTTFTDSTGRNTLLVVGNAQVDTGVTPQFGTGSMQVASPGHNRVIVSGNFALGYGDLTVDFWIRPDTMGSNIFNMVNQDNGVIADAWQIYSASTGVVSLFANGLDRIQSGAGAISVGNSAHIAWTRANAVSRLFVNGSQVGSNYADVNHYPAAALGVGMYSGETGSYHMDEVRISTFAQWISNFIPPTSAYLP